MPNGDDGSGFFGIDFGGIATGLLDAIVAVIDAIIAFLNALVQALIKAFNQVVAGEQFIYGFSLSGLAEVFRSLKQIMEQIFHAVILAALTHLRDLFLKLQAWVRKLKAWLDKLRAIQQQYHVKAFRDFINMIQRIRRILIIFRLFHLKFATKLDNWLAGIEGTLIRREVAIAQKTNEILGWLNLILDPVHGLTHLPLFLGMGKSIDGFLTLFSARGIDYWFSKPPAAGYGVGAPIAAPHYYNNLQADLATGGGDVGTWRAGFAQSMELTKELR